MNFLSKYILLLVIGMASLVCAQTKNLVPKTYTAYKTAQKINIDGEDLDEAWQNILWSEPFIDIEGIKQPTYKTQVKMLWDDTYFYVLAKMKEPHV